LGSKGDKGQQSFKMVVFHVPDDRALVLDGLAFDLRGWNLYVYPPTDLIQSLLRKLDQQILWPR